MGAFFHAVGVFFQHLAEVKWEALGLALACQAIKLGFRSYAWRSILRAAYPAQRLKLRSVFGAYVAGVGVNAVVPARAGDVVKMYLVKQRLQDASYATLAPTLVVETLFDFVVATGLLLWALSLGVLPTNQVYAKLPSVDWQWFVRHDRFSLALLVALFLATLVGLVWARMRWREFKQRVGMGFAILRDRPRFVRGVIVPQAISWVFRIAGLFFFLQAFGVHASLHNALLAQVVESLATLFPATPGGAGTKQGLIVYLFRHQAVSSALLLAFSVGMNIALVVENLALGLVAVGLMTRNFSFKRLRAASQADDRAVSDEPGRPGS
ncbi:MAG: lysylphosphatidylglycerol synthase transmembrane domain-containing protein [Gaiellaceae bacterium]